MSDILAALPQAAGLIEKGGIIGLLLLVLAFLIYEVRRLRKENTRVYGLRDKWRAGYLLLKAACDFHKIQVDLSSIQDVEREDAAA